MRKDEETTMNIVIVGAGKLGIRVAEAFSQEQNSLTIIDQREVPLSNAASTLDVLTVQGSGLQLSVLEQANVAKADLFVAVTSSDEVNILASSSAKKMGCPLVIARVRDPVYGSQLAFFREQFDIDYIANPEAEMAKEIARYLLRGYAVNMENFADGRVGMVDFRVHNLKGVAGQRIRDLDLPRCLLIAAILRSNETIIPHGDIQLEDGDVIYVIGKRDSVNEFSLRYGAPMHKHPVRRVMILGGGRAGFQLAHRLLQNNVAVKIIEQDEDRCLYLSENLKGALIIQGDATDRNLLDEENTDEMDALISATGIDEENLLLALLGKQLGIEKVIAKVSRPNYVPIIEQLGIDLAINPVLLMASDILRFVQGTSVVSLSLLMQGEAEVLEVIAKQDSRLVGQPLGELQLPKGIIVGAIVHNGNVVVPGGDAVIHPGDRVIIFCLQSEMAALERLLNTKKRGLLHELWDSRKSIR